jgi:hypothetical protein
VRLLDASLPSGFAAAGNSGTLQVRITATLRAPKAIERSRFFGNPFAGPPEIAQLSPDSELCVAQVHPTSQFNEKVNDGSLPADERDDREYVDQFLIAQPDEPVRDGIANTLIIINPVDPTIEPGMRVRRISTDQWVLDMAGDARRLPVISRVRHRFGEQQHTEVELSGFVRVKP